MLKHFYATSGDLIPVFDLVESKFSLFYIQTGLFHSKAFPKYEHRKYLPTLGELAPITSAAECPAYLVLPRSAQVSVREVSQKSGVILYAVDELSNPDGVTIQHGGFSTTDVLLSGRVGTSSDSSEAKKLYRAFGAALEKCFSRINAYQVGSEAMTAMSRGCRLTIGVHSAPEYDLKL